MQEQVGRRPVRPLHKMGLSPAFLIRRFSPLYPFAVPCGRLAAEAAALPTDRCTRLCSASSATGSAEQRCPRGKAFGARKKGGTRPSLLLLFGILEDLLFLPEVVAAEAEFVAAGIPDEAAQVVKVGIG